MSKQKNQNRKLEKQARQLQKMERELARPRGKGYLWYTIFVVTIIYLADEIASQINNQMNSVVAQEVFAPVFGAEVALARMGLVGLTGALGSILAILYKPLSDRYGRKLFLLLNTLGMGVGMVVIAVGCNIPAWMVGCFIIQFFIPHDIQQLYLFETVPAEKRGTYYSVIKGITTLGVLLIPVLRSVIMGNDLSRWNVVYLVLGIFALAVTAIAAFRIRETVPFLTRRIEYLKQPEELRAAAKEDKTAANADGGLGAAIRFSFRNKQIRSLMIAAGFITWGMMMTNNYEAVMSQGYMTQFLNQGMDIANARTAAVPLVTDGLLLFPVGMAILMTLQGIIADQFGRKSTVLIMGVSCIAFYLMFYFGSVNHWNPYVVGLFCGASIGGYWGCADTVNLYMVTESTPTNMRASVLSVTPIVCAVMTIVVGLVSAAVINVFGDQLIGPVNLCMVVPGMAFAIILIMTKVNETKGVDLTKVTGLEE